MANVASEDNPRTRNSLCESSFDSFFRFQRNPTPDIVSMQRPAGPSRLRSKWAAWIREWKFVRFPVPPVISLASSSRETRRPGSRSRSVRKIFCERVRSPKRMSRCRAVKTGGCDPSGPAARFLSRNALRPSWSAFASKDRMPFCPSSSKMRRTSSTDEMTGLFVVDVTADDIVRTSGIPLRFGSAAVGPDCTFRGVASFMVRESTTDAFKNHQQS